jgi:hypothetical protein
MPTLTLIHTKETVAMRYSHHSIVLHSLIIAAISVASAFAATTARGADYVVIINPQSGGTLNMNGGGTVTVAVQFSSGLNPLVARIQSADGNTNYGDTNNFTPYIDPFYGLVYLATISIPNGNYSNITVFAKGYRLDPVLGVVYASATSTGVTINK